MSTLTAAEWNERYPVGTPVLTRRFDGTPFVGITTGPAQTVDGRTYVDTWFTPTDTPGFGHIAGGTAVVDIEPFATDAQRRAEGWVDPQSARDLTDEVHRLWMLAADATRDRDAATTEAAHLRDDLEQSHRHIQVLMAVVDAAAIISPATHPSPVVRSLVKAVDALDTRDLGPTPDEILPQCPAVDDQGRRCILAAGHPPLPVPPWPGLSITQDGHIWSAPPPCPDCGPGYRLGGEGCRHG